MPNQKLKLEPQSREAFDGTTAAEKTSLPSTNSKTSTHLTIGKDNDTTTPHPEQQTNKPSSVPPPIQTSGASGPSTIPNPFKLNMPDAEFPVATFANAVPQQPLVVALEIPAVLTMPAPNKTIQPTDNAKQLKTLGNKSEIFLALGLVGIIVALFAFGRANWNEDLYTPEEGIGYMMGLIAGVMILLACTYSLGKHFKFFRMGGGMMKAWLRVHIAFGVIGPLLGVVHSTFTFHSINGGVVLISMLLVFLSGIMGRYLYSKVHYGLGGKRAQVKDVQNILNETVCSHSQDQLEAFKRNTLAASKSITRASWQLFWYGLNSRLLRRRVVSRTRAELKTALKAKTLTRAQYKLELKQAKKQVNAYLTVLRKVAFFSFYERFFSFWRHAHVPLLYLLLLSGVAHVFYVHMY